MRWLGATLALLAACAGLIAGIYLRDRDPAGWRPPDRQLARADAAAVLAALDGSDCPAPCAAELLDAPRQHHWVARLRLRSGIQCVEIDVQRFAWTDQGGFSGVTGTRCRPPGAAIAPPAT